MSAETHELKAYGAKVVLEDDGSIGIWISSGAGIYNVEQWQEIVSFVSAQVDLITDREGVA